MLFRSIIDREVGRRRQNVLPADVWSRYPLSFLLGGYRCVRRDEHFSYGNLADHAPPFGLAFSSAPNQQNLLAAANEEGFVKIYNTESHGEPVLRAWRAHENAVFDIAWVPGLPQLVTAAGDQMARLWDVQSGEVLGLFKGHLCSLKSVAFAPQENAVFSTGARDGNIIVWDTRCSKKDGFYRPMKQISGAHYKLETSIKRPGNARGMAPNVGNQQSVTGVLFRDQHTLISSGAVDAVIKMWDLRKNYTAHNRYPVPLQTYPYPGSCLRTQLGYSGLVLDSSSSNVMCNCTDHKIYMFNVSGINTSPVAVFSGHQNASYYVKSTISPDGQFLASGSSDAHTYIWKISDPKQPTMTLQGHGDEVTSVVWCPTDFTKIASCSDDNTIRIWRLQRETFDKLAPEDKANLVGWAHPYSIKADITTAMNQRTESLLGLASPQLASCAPSGATLPLPSSTASPTNTEKTKAAAIRQQTPTSLKQWLSPRHGSPSQVCPPLHEDQSLCPQIPAISTFPTERLAKRRLETSDTSSAGCEGAEWCKCVTELCPVAKRSRPMPGICSPVRESPEKTGCDKVDSNKLLSSKHTGTETCPSTMTNWLSAIGKTMKERQESSNTPRTPIASKKREVNKAASPNFGPAHSMKEISMYFRTKPQE